MAKTIVVGGFGPGISRAVAEKFGSEGYSVALVARRADKLAAGVAALKAKGIEARAFPAELGDAAAVRALIGEVRQSLGPVAVLHWNAYSRAAGDLLTADVAAVHSALDVALVGLLTAVQAALPDLEQHKGAVLVTNGGFGKLDPKVDVAAAQANAMGLALANAAKRKLVGLLAAKLGGKGIYVGEVVVVSTVKGTEWDSGAATLDPATVAEQLWKLYTERKQTSVEVG